jgi:fibronectin-binding autotransporter adhesin
VNLATAVTSYSDLAGLVLNPQAGTLATYGGVIANGAAGMTLTKNGLGSQTLTNACVYTGATTVGAGTLALGGPAGTVLTSAFTVKGGTLLLDNSGGTWANRLADATALSLGSLTLKSFNGAGVQSESVGATTFATGGKVTIDIGGGSDQTTLALGNVSRSAGAAIDFVGAGGTLGGGVNSPNITSTSWPALGNGILAWATVNGTNWASTGANGIVDYAGTFVDPTSATSDATKNAQLIGSGTMSSAKSFNSLNVIASGAGQSLSLGGILTSGAILKSGTENYTISGAGNITAGAELIAHVDGGALTISAPLNTAIVGVAKGGTGDLILSGTRNNNITGSASTGFYGAISIAGGNLEFQGASTMLQGVISGAGGLIANLNSGQVLTIKNTGNSFTGPILIKSGALFNGMDYSTQGVPGGGTSVGGLGNIEINGGTLGLPYYFGRYLGTGSGQIQITGGTSGFNGIGNTPTFTLNGSAGYEVVWGNAFFQPTTLVLNDVQATTVFNFQNKIDLNGTTRTVAVNSATLAATISGVIRNSSATAGITKIGVGELALNGANIFNGGVTVSGGTLSVSTLANGGSPSGLGTNSSAAANLLIANGTTLKYTGGAVSSDRSFTINGTADGHSASLDASGSGAINLTSTATPAYGTAEQTRTLNLTGTSTGNNTLAATLADNGSGAVAVTKTGAGTWVLSGASSYTGPTTLSGGLLSMSATNNLGDASANVVFNGGGLQITGTTLTTLSGIGHTISFTPGVAVALDIASAANTFTVDQPLVGTGITKSGPGTLIFGVGITNSGATTISGGILQYDDGLIIPTTPLVNNGTLMVNRTGTDTQGSTFHSIMGGTGSLIKTNIGTLALNNANIYSGVTRAAQGTIALSHPLAIQNSAIDTTGAGAFTLSGVLTNALTLGGLTGTTNLDLAITTGYNSVTNLTLNPSGTVTYGGVIADGASGMMLTKTGAGIQVLANSNTYTGATILNAGTLTLNSAAGSLASTNIALVGGNLTLDNSSGTGNAGNRVSDSAVVTLNGGSALNFTHNGASATDYSETIDTLSLQSGFLTYNGSQANATGPRASNLSFNTLSSSGTATVNFAGAGLGVNARNTITFGAGVTAGQDLGPWAVVNGADFATYDATLGVKAASSTALAVNSTGASTNWKLNNNITLDASLTPSYKTLLTSTSGAKTLALNGNIVSVGGISSITDNHNITGSGALQTLAAGDPFYINVGGNTLAISSVIRNVGAGATASALVKSGTGSLTLSGANTYSGGTVINAGTLTTTTPNSNLGAGAVTVNGPVTWNFGTSGSSRALTINDGAVLSLTGTSGLSFSGVLSGNGTLSQTGSIGIHFSNTDNTFTGPISIAYQLTFASLGDSSNPINFGGTSGWLWSGGAKMFALRPFTLNAAGNSPLNNNGSGALVIQQPLAITGAAGARTLTLGGSYGTTANQFAGYITDGPGSVVSLTKGNDASIWALSGTNSYSGATTLNAGVVGTVAVNGAFIFQGIQALSPYTMLTATSAASNGGKVPGTFKILDDSASPASRSGVNLSFSGGNGQDPLTIFVGNNNTANGGTSAGTTTGSIIQLGNMSFTQTASSTAGLSLDVTGANGYKLQINNVRVSIPSYAGAWNTKLNPTTAPLTVAGNVQQVAGGTGTVNLQLDGTATNNLIAGNILDSADGSPKALALTKQNTSEWILSGTNTYTGITKISGGTLQAIPGIGLPSASYLQLDGGVLQATGTFTRVNSTTVNGDNVQWLSANGGGFSAKGGKLTVAIDNNVSTEQVWGTAVGNNVIYGPLKFGSATANSEVEFQNNINLAAAARTVDVASGTGGDFATLSGVIRTASGTAGITKTGAGTLVLSGANTYNGATTISAGGGTLAVSSISNVASPNPLGQSSAVAANLLLGNTTTLKYTGPTASTDRSFTINGTAAGNQATLDASGTGAITFANTASPAYGTTAQTRVLKLTGSNTDNNTLAANLPNNGTGAVSIQKSGAGTWVISGSNTYSGTTTVDLGTLRLGGMNALPTNSTVVIGAGTLDMAGYTKTVNTLDVTGAATINLGSGGKLVFADSSAKTWGGTLVITGTFVSSSSLKFGTTSGGLNASQLAKISSPGVSSFTLDGNGYLVAIRPTLIQFF